MLHLNSHETTFEHQRVPAARFNILDILAFDCKSRNQHQSPEVKSCAVRAWVLVLLYPESLLFHSLCAIQPDLHVI